MSELNVVIAADIFGVSAKFRELCQQISLNEVDANVIFHPIGPYQIQPDNFLSESDAYHYFSEHAGVDAYSQKLIDLLEVIDGPKLLIGFSVGGSAIWQLMPKLVLYDVLSTVCFYSGQIRHMTAIVPTVPCQLIMANSEAHFSVNELLETLRGKANLRCEQSDYQHGFLNKLSANYHAHGAEQYLCTIRNLISKVGLTIR